jgi:hypothetical protein
MQRGSSVDAIRVGFEPRLDLFVYGCSGIERYVRAEPRRSRRVRHDV